METEIVEEVEELFENEWYIVRHSGETPEIAYNSAIYFLTRAADGPRISLCPSQVKLLRQAAVDRYEEIVLRDLYHANIAKPIYRGVARSICNYQRFTQFCQRQDLCPCEITKRCADLLATFLEVEYDRTFNNGQVSVINCSFQELKNFALTLGVSFPSEYSSLEALCPEPRS